MRTQLVLLLLAVMLLPSGVLQGEAVAQTQERYLAFQFFSGSSQARPGTSGQVLGLTAPHARLEAFFESLVSQVAETGKPGSRLAVMVGPLAFDQPDQALVAHMQHAFALAREHDIAVGFHLDESKFHLGYPPFQGRPDILEWTGWSETPSTGQLLNWGEEFRLGPQLCLNHPFVVQESRRRARDVFGATIAAELETLRQEGRSHLFAGVIVGWETAVGLDAGTRRRTGYHALSRLGLGRTSTDEELAAGIEQVVAGILGVWGQELLAAGIPGEKLYSHIAFDAGLPGGSLPGGEGLDERVPAFRAGGATPQNALSDWGLPGYSTYPSRALFERVHATVAAASPAGWASSEGANVFLVPGGAILPPDTLESYLARMFNHGATLTNVFGWDIGAPDNPFRLAAEAPESIAAYRKFLQGQPLEEVPLEESHETPQEQLRGKIARMQAAIPAHVAGGGDPVAITRLVRKLEGHLQQGQVLEAGQLVDEILAIVDPGAPGPAGQEGSP